MNVVNRTLCGDTATVAGTAVCQKHVQDVREEWYCLLCQRQLIGQTELLERIMHHRRDSNNYDYCRTDNYVTEWENLLKGQYSSRAIISSFREATALTLP